MLFLNKLKDGEEKLFLEEKKNNVKFYLNSFESFL
jgi:hypothetical protein